MIHIVLSLGIANFKELVLKVIFIHSQSIISNNKYLLFTINSNIYILGIRIPRIRYGFT